MTTNGTRLGRAALATAIVAASSIVVAVAAPTAIAGAASFDPVTSASMGAQTAFGRVVTNGAGTFLAVARQNTLAQRLVVQRSVDAGTTWTTAAMFAGFDGGATRPWLAIDGNVAAVTFVGAWCDRSTTTPTCLEAPYVAVSLDGGASWGAPQRVGRQAFSVRVAVDDDRLFVAIERSGGVDLVGYHPESMARFVALDFAGTSPHLAAGDGLAILTYASTTATDTIIGVVVDGRNARAPRTFTDRRFGHWESSVAAADGRVHLLTRHAGSAALEVITAGASGVFGTPVTVAPAGRSNAIAAAAGAVAVAIAGEDGITSVSTSSDGGASFTAPIPATSTPGGEPNVEIGIARSPVGQPVSRFEWTVADRYVDVDGDGTPEPANATGNLGLDANVIFDRAVLEVQLYGCDSIPGPGRSITDYTWLVDGSIHDTGCTSRLQLADDDAVEVTLLITNDQGETAASAETVAPRDHLIVSIGDSVGSGEGNPHTPLPNLTWEDTACHRSAFAGPALAAQRLERADPHSSVTFVQLTCSGAAIVDTPEQPGVDDPDTGGLLDAYHGVDEFTLLRPAQLAQMDVLVGSRPVDALLVSVGANDVRFKEVVMGCLLPFHHPCNESTIATEFEQRLAALPARYDRLAAAIDERGIAPDRVRLTEYFDPTSDDLGVVQMRCVGEIGLITDDEARWAKQRVIDGLNSTGAASAASHGWRFVGGIAGRYLRHGYCAEEHWVVQIDESDAAQDDPFGAFHPNRAGQTVYGDALYADLRSSLLTVTPSGSGVAAGPATLGNVMIVTATRTHVTSVAVKATGGIPLIGSARLLDRLVLGDGLVGPAGPPAVDHAAAVGAWHELSGAGAFDTEVRLATLGVRPNVSVRSIDIVQSATGARLLVADRPFVVTAVVDASLTDPEAVDVTTTVLAHDGSGNVREVLAETTESVTLRPGRQTVVLPRLATTTVTARPGERLSAVVEFEDPLGSSPGDGFDNRASTVDAREPSAVAGRPLTILWGDAYVGPGSVTCQTVTAAAQRMTRFAAETMPVGAPGIDSDLFCGFRTEITQTEPGVLESLTWLDELARYAGIDALVAVVPPGWLQVATGDAIGVAVSGLRAAIVEADASPSVFAHELAHVYGATHTDGPIATTGVNAARRPVAGFDWMAPVAQSKPWAGAPTWDRLAVTIGGPDQAPVAVSANGTGMWVRGTVVPDDSGGWALTPGRWVPGPASTPPSTQVVTDPLDLADLELERLTAQQLDASGAALGEPVPIPLGRGDGLHAPGSSPATGDPIGYGFAARIDLDPQAAAIELTLDATTTEVVAISAPPSVTLDTPAGGEYVPRGEPLEVAWNASDPDSPDLVTHVLISDDGGASYQPLALAVAGSSISMPMPIDVGGDQVRVKVVVTDGTRFAEAVSPAFNAEPDPTLGEEKIVFIRQDQRARRWNQRVMVMDADGSNAVDIGLPVQSDDFFNACTPNCQPYNRDPAWDGDRIIFSSTLQLRSVGDIECCGEFRLWDVGIDGSGLRPLTPLSTDGAWWGTNRFGQSYGSTHNACASVSPDGSKLAWFGSRYTGDVFAHVWISDRTGDRWSPPRRVIGNDVAVPVTLHPSFNADATPPVVLLNGHPNVIGGQTDEVSPISCPRWTTDGTSVVLVAGQVNYRVDDNGTSRARFASDVVVEVRADGSAARVISPAPTMIPGVGAYAGSLYQADWHGSVEVTPDDRVLVTRAFAVTYDTSTGTLPFRELTGVFELDPATGSYTRLTPEPDQRITWDRPYKLKVSPSGQVYGTLFEFQDCDGQQWQSTTLGVLEPATGDVSGVAIDPLGGCPQRDRHFDWGVVGGGGGSGGPAVLEPLDPADAPEPGSPPVDESVDEVTVAAASPAAGADELMFVVPSPAADAEFVVPAGLSTPITLRTVAGATASMLVTRTPDSVDVTSPAPSPIGIESDATGVLIVTPQPGFVGVTTMAVVAAGTDQPATITIRVVGNLAPTVNPDSITVTAGVDTVIAPDLLLANDVDPDTGARRTEAVGALEVVSVFGSGNGDAWIDAAGAIHVLAESSGSFTYTAADADGATGSATVTVEAIAATTSTSSTSTTSSSTSTSTSTTTTLRPVGTLPRTGGTSAPTLVVALILLAAGGGALLASRRR